MLAVAIVVSLQTVGLLMSVAMLVNPATTARLLTNKVSTMTAAAVAIGVATAVIGLTASYHLGSPPGATVALAGVAILTLTVAAVTPTRALQRARRHHRPAPSTAS